MYSVPRFEEINRVDRYTLLCGLPKYQLPPTSSSRSRQSNAMPHSRKFLATASPDEPAPRMQNLPAVGGAVTSDVESDSVADRLAVRTVIRPIVGERPAGRQFKETPMSNVAAIGQTFRFLPLGINCRAIVQRRHLGV